jgi:hypothetical protein
MNQFEVFKESDGTWSVRLFGLDASAARDLDVAHLGLVSYESAERSSIQAEPLIDTAPKKGWDLSGKGSEHDDDPPATPVQTAPVEKPARAARAAKPRAEAAPSTDMTDVPANRRMGHPDTLPAQMRPSGQAAPDADPIPTPREPLPATLAPVVVSAPPAAVADAGKAVSEVQESAVEGGVAGLTTALILEVSAMTRVVDIVAKLREVGVEKESEIVDACEALRPRVPTLARVSDMRGRVHRVLDALLG